MMKFSKHFFAIALMAIISVLSMYHVTYADEEFKVSKVVISNKEYDDSISKNNRDPYEIIAKVESLSGKVYKGKVAIDFFGAKNKHQDTVRGEVLYDKDNGMYFYGITRFKPKNWKAVKISFAGSLKALNDLEYEGLRFELSDVSIEKGEMSAQNTVAYNAPHKVKGKITCNSGAMYAYGTALAEGFNDKGQHIGYMNGVIAYDAKDKVMYFNAKSLNDFIDRWKTYKVIKYEELAPLKIELKAKENPQNNIPRPEDEFTVSDFVVIPGMINDIGIQISPHTLHATIKTKSGKMYRGGDFSFNIFDKNGKDIDQARASVIYDAEKNDMRVEGHIAYSAIINWKAYEIKDVNSLVPTREIEEQFKLGEVNIEFKSESTGLFGSQGYSVKSDVTNKSGNMYESASMIIDVLNDEDSVIRKIRGELKYDDERKTMYFSATTVKPDENWKQYKVSSYENPVPLKTPEEIAAIESTKKQSEFTSEFIQALKKGHIDSVRAFLEEGGDPNMLHMGNPIIFYAIESGNLELVTLLVDKGADVNKSNEREMCPLRSALFAAAMTGELNILDFLRERGATIDKRSR